MQICFFDFFSKQFQYNDDSIKKLHQYFPNLFRSLIYSLDQEIVINLGIIIYKRSKNYESENQILQAQIIGYNCRFLRMMSLKIAIQVFVFYIAIVCVSNSSCDGDCCRTLTDRKPMTYVYYQKSGRFVGGSGQYSIDTCGYSGQGKGYLNPDEQCTPNIGPLPASIYKLAYCKNMMHQTSPKPCSFYLDPQRPEQICNRSDFFIHGCQCCTNGDDIVPPPTGCSAGCVIINYENRKKLRIGDTLIVKSQEISQQLV